MTEAAPKALSVAAALAIAKGQLEAITVRIVGEVSELSNKPGYAAVYFTLKDAQEKASLPCLMWMNRFKASGIQLKVGAVVEVTGRFSLYAAKGRMNFDVSSIVLAGEGDIRMRIANLAKKLEAEGLMRPEMKLPIPVLPARIGLVTSPRGAAVYDVLRTLRRRYPLAEVVVAGVPVEGADAPAHLIAGLDAVAAAGAEVILLVRGGGSFEDLMPFNDEALARHIAALPVCVVTGIGHEPDTSIADMVADVRASTPTAAAEAVAPALADLRQALCGIARRMGFAEASLISQHQRALSDMRTRPLFADPLALIRDDAQGLDDLSSRLALAIPRSVARAAERVAHMRMRLAKVGPRVLAEPTSRLVRMRVGMEGAGRALVRPYKERVAVDAAKLESLSPLAVLTRGYAAAFTEEGHVISSVEGVSVGDEVDVRVADGVMGCQVMRIAREEYSFIEGSFA